MVTQKDLRYAEDYKPGDVFELGAYEVTRDEIIELSRKYDPFPFHVDEEAARATAYGGLIASGWLTALVWLRFLHRALLCHETTLGSPGHEEMRWPRPAPSWGPAAGAR
jgi:acyl dehydratase